MRNFSDKRLGYFGNKYELKVIKQLIGSKEPRGVKVRRDDAFGRKMLRKVSPLHFDNPQSQKIIKYLQDYFTELNKVPYYDTLEAIVREDYLGNEVQGDKLMEYVDKIKASDADDYEYTQKTSIDFINTKNIYLAWKAFERDCINQGKYHEYRKYAQQMVDNIVSIEDEDELEAMVAGDHRDLNEGERHTITTGIPSLDIDMNGGLAIGELALIIAGLKVGKTTFASVLANNAAMKGYNVLQLYFEDTTEQVKLKHRAKFTGKGLSAVASKSNRKTIAKLTDKALNKMKKNDGCLVLHKMDSTNTTVADIEKLIKKAKDRGVWFQDEKVFKKITFDVVMIDYVDCIKPKAKFKEDWGGDKEVLRDLERLCSKKYGLGFACWAFTQGGRASLNANMVTVEDMGGSIKKAQIAHFIASIAKNLEQRAIGQGTFSILGSRLGRDGIIYKDCTFDNATLEIEFRKEGNIADITTNDALLR